MNRILFLLVLCTVLLLLDIYSYQGLKIAVSDSSPWFQKIAKTLFWALTGLTLLGFILFEPLSQTQSGRRVVTLLMTLGVANFLGKLFMSLFMLVDDLVRLIKWGVNKAQSESVGEPISRSKFLMASGAITAALPLLGMTWGVVSGAHDYRIVKRNLKLKRLPKAFDGVKIVHISDIHSGSFWSKKVVERGVEMINELKPDYVFFTGDLVNNKADEMDDWLDVFGRIRPREQVFSTLGNHDYGDYVPWDSPLDKSANLDRLKKHHADMGWRLLMNESVRIQRGEESIVVMGIENWSDKGRFPKYGDLSKAHAGLQLQDFKLLLSHDPSHWRAEVLKAFQDIDITFSGHTHGMQFGIEVGSVKWSPVKYFYPEWADLYSEKEQHLYVNRGFGYIGYPGRLGIRPEITLMTLNSA